MSALLDRVRRTIRRHDLANADTRLVLAVSGGSDSVALAYLMRELHAAGELRVVGLAHFNHRLRANADRDERFCAALAETLGWPLSSDSENVADRAEQERRSMEDAARTARHEFFERARLQLGADCVAVGHTRDDQAETFLLRLVRGAGPRGLAAMHPRRGAVIRPLLDCRRAELQAYLAANGIAFVEDETNRDVAIPRNRVRAELVPLLERRFNPAIVDVLADEADVAREEWRWMEGAADELYRAATLEAGADNLEPRTQNLDIAALLRAPVALRRLVLWRALTQGARGRPVSFDHVEAVLTLIASDGATAAVDSPGQRVERIGPRLVLTSRPEGQSGRPPAQGKAPTNLFRYPLSVPGEVDVPHAGCVVSVERGAPGTTAGTSSGSTAGSGSGGDLVEIARSAAVSNRAVAVVRSDLCQGPLAVRNRRPGDWFRPVGVDGRKKLQDFFVDRKVARRERDAVPLVVDDRDQIVWVAGYGIDEAFRVTDASQAVLILTLRQA